MKINLLYSPNSMMPYGGLFWGINGVKLALEAANIEYISDCKLRQDVTFNHHSNFIDFARYFTADASHRHVVHIHGWHEATIFPGKKLTVDFINMMRVISPVFSSKSLVNFINFITEENLVSDYLWNTADPTIFYPSGKIRNDRGLISVTNFTFAKGIDRLNDVGKQRKINVIGKVMLEKRHSKSDYSFLNPLGSFDDPKEIASRMQKSSIFIHLSRLESCSLAIIQALMCGLPVIYTDVGDNFKMVGSGGICVAGNNVEEILHAEHSIKTNYKKYREGALKEAQKFYPKIIGKQWETYYFNRQKGLNI